MKANKKILGLVLLSTSLIAIGCTKNNQEETPLTQEVENNDINSSDIQNIQEVEDDEFKEEHSKIDGEYVCSKIYSYDSESDILVPNHYDLTELTPENIIKALGEKGIIDKDTKVLGYNESENNGEKIGELNLSAEFQDFNLGSSGSLGRLDAVARTVIENLEIDKLKLLLEGQNYEDGHMALDDDYFFTIENTNIRSIG